MSDFELPAAPPSEADTPSPSEDSDLPKLDIGRVILVDPRALTGDVAPETELTRMAASAWARVLGRNLDKLGPPS